ncbi:ectonucleoside triphosphate diphosphohydrolase 2 [Latimeria chalumnae]|uniref:Ectonucleoside triphosphate diphosphohydrolase 2 n=1 Tax=Latimeria chalumnae TaxID=7897 RepID=H3B8K3_LATCH|nr:PREDICTED: ectonucleoside triphosphate diphosphohydrolase 2 [Latimeria chalumnae]|eukprot:XP_014342004.1 PREDICTED: ectonucleoside triphosphate diphosphohydrolase 2 [Latimeria chalumnae]
MGKKYVFLATPLLLCLAAIIGIILLNVLPSSVRDSPPVKYGIVLDAGSSHTTMYVYKWPADKENDTGIVSEHTMCNVDGGGISSYAENPLGAGNSLKKCLNQALSNVPKDQHHETPLYLGATAGMRLLNLTDFSASKKVLSAVSSTLQSYPFNFKGAKILSGQEEGVLGWITANYLLENFIKYSWIGQWIHSKRETIGAMDLGGASTQISFLTNERIEDPENEVNLHLYGYSYKVYTHSFLCYGRDQILKRLLSKVIKVARANATLMHPCWPEDLTQGVFLRDVYDSPCTAFEKPKPYNSTMTVQVQGTGNGSECRMLVESLFQFNRCNYSKCSFDGVFQPNVTGSYIAFAAFYYTIAFVSQVTNWSIDAPDDLEKATEIICAKKCSELYAKAPDQEKRLKDYCAMSTFVSVLTTQGYKFSEKSFRKISFQRKAGDTSIGWALGYMLNLTNMIPTEEIPHRIGLQHKAWATLTALFVIVLLLSVMMFCCLFESQKAPASI